MKCFNHPIVDAVGVCKSCGRGLCRDCVAEVGLGVACRNRCEAVVETLNDLVERGRTAYQKNSSTVLRIGIFTFLMGALFLILGGVSLKEGARGPWAYFIPAMGALFIGMGVSYFISAKRIRQK